MNMAAGSKKGQLLHNKTDAYKEVMRYDGTRFITEEEIDNEYTGQWVLVNLDGTSNPWDGGYLVATADGIDEMRPIIDRIGIIEFRANAMVYYGCKERGGNLHVELHD